VQIFQNPPLVASPRRDERDVIGKSPHGIPFPRAFVSAAFRARFASILSGRPPFFLMDLREEGSQKGSFFVKVSLSDPDPPPALEEAGSDGDSFGLGEGVSRKSFFGGDHCDRNPTAERLYVEGGGGR